MAVAAVVVAVVLPGAAAAVRWPATTAVGAPAAGGGKC